MYLSNVDFLRAIADGSFVFQGGNGPPIVCDTSIDLHLDSIEEAKVWDTERLAELNQTLGNRERNGLELRVGQWDYNKIAAEYLIPPPNVRNKEKTKDALVLRRDSEIIIRPFGFVLWQTKEIIGTPRENAKYICFIDTKSKKARTGLMVHLAAPTIHGRWAGNVTLEMCNLGPLNLVLEENDVVAQIVIAQLSCPPDPKLNTVESTTHGQTNVAGNAHSNQSKK